MVTEWTILGSVTLCDVGAGDPQLRGPSAVEDMGVAGDREFAGKEQLTWS